ncbi:MAG: PrgI family protein [Bacilli bacterium]
MIYVKVPKEIKEYEDKILLGLSIRELGFGGTAVLLAISFTVLNTYYLHMDNQIVSYIIMFICIPLFCCGFIDISGIKFDKYIRIICNFYLRKQKLTYIDETYLWKKENKNHVTKTVKNQRKSDREKYKERD